MLKIITILFLFLSLTHARITKKILQSDSNLLRIEINIESFTESDIFPISFLVGLPSNQNPIVNIDYQNKSPLPFSSDQNIFKKLESSAVQELQNLAVLPITVSPLINQTEYFKTIIVKIEFNNSNKNYRQPYKNEIEFLKNRIINWKQAKNWFIKKEKSSNRMIEYPEGKWFQFFVENDGIVNITKSDLDKISSSSENKDPRSFSVFMSNELGRSRTQTFNQEIVENFNEISIMVLGEEDGIFDSEDKIVFYARGPSGFNFTANDLEWQQNVFFDTNSCWLFIPENDSLRGKRVQQANQPDSGILIDYGLNKVHLETDLINLEASGTEWVSSPITSGSSQSILANLKSPKSGVNLEITLKFRGHSTTGNSSSYHSINLYNENLNGDLLGSLNWSGNSARTLTSNTNSITLEDGINFFYLKNSTTDNNSSPYLDYTEIKYGRELELVGHYDFISPVSDQNVRFSFLGEDDELVFYLWDISDPITPKFLILDNNNFCNVDVTSSNIGHFIGFNILNTNKISNLILKENQEFFKLRNQNLSADYLVIGPKSFKDLTIELLDLRSPAIYASIEDIYDEFSAGNKDPMAIRSFVQWTQEKWADPHPNCLLLLGDAGYDYRNITGKSSIIVPTIQVQSSRSYATDDLLVSLYGNLPEIATGRFPAKNREQVTNFVNKVLDIEKNKNFGPWRQKVTLVADDASRPEPNHGSISTGKSHTLNTEQLVELIPQNFYIEKIYMMEYPEVSDASAYGVIKPDATDALLNSLNNGTAIVSYIGHGSPIQLAQEKLLDLDRGDLNQIKNSGKLPLWIVGTCSFGHFDDPLTESFSEALIRDPMNAASMVISTTRPITVVGNERYTQDLFENIFLNNQVSDSKVGIILQSIKDGTNESKYFHLFGDPALKIPMPKEVINNISISPDTLKTLSVGSFSGNQTKINQNGEGFVTLYDANRYVTRDYTILSEDYSLSYNLTGSTLFRGEFTFNGNIFNGQVRIPKDISYSNNPSKMIFYIHDNESELSGSLNNIFLKGGSDSSDFFGPKITFETSDGRRLENGDHLFENTDLRIRFSDPMGINLTNEAGHEILIINKKSDIPKNYTNNFSYDQNSITTGTISYSSNDSEIELTIRAWDNANNPNDKEIKLFTQTQNNLRLNNVYNFPNPFSNFTQFAFEINQNATIKIDIYTIGGRKIISFNKNNISAGYHTINWNGLDAFGGKIANGIYIYRIKANGESSTTSHIGRCAKY